MTRVKEKRRSRSDIQRVDTGTSEKLTEGFSPSGRPVAVAAVVMLLLPAVAHAGSHPPRPSKNYPGLSAYVEVIPTATGGSATSKPDVAATNPAVEPSTKPSGKRKGKSGRGSKLLNAITSSSKYGAPQSSSAAVPTATTESQGSAFGTGWISAIAIMLFVSAGAAVIARRRHAGRR